MGFTSQGFRDLYKKEDWWAIWLGLGIVILSLVMFAGGSSIGDIAIEPPKWKTLDILLGHLMDYGGWYILLFLCALIIFGFACFLMGYELRRFLLGFLVIFSLAFIILVFSTWDFASRNNLEAPLVALLVGLIGGNLFPISKSIDTAFRTEFYVKTGIVLLGATLPFTLILEAGWVAFIQATIVSISTFLTIYFVAVKLGLPKPFGACMGAGGSVCGVSATIAVGTAVGASKEHMSIGISLVSIWAIIMIFVLPIVSKALGQHPGVAGAWIGNSEFADAAGFAAAQAIGSESAIRSYTLVKVIGRDIWIGLWAFILCLVSLLFWEKGKTDRKASVSEIWIRFPKFVLGFFITSLLITVISAYYSEGIDRKTLDWAVISPIKTLRTWTFILTFLSIGFTTRFRELAGFGWSPFFAFTAGVAVNVPLGYVLSEWIFGNYWRAM